jgi:hypothetical protein|tara:strand:- start:23 stop:307 length:285 start_codon:yes stop_codon:yes gene_type:complete
MKANEDNLNVECTGCGAKMSNADFNQHQCPNIAEPIAGESFEVYSARCVLKKHRLIFNKDANGYSYLTAEDGQEVLDEWVEAHPEVADAFFILS